MKFQVFGLLLALVPAQSLAATEAERARHYLAVAKAGEEYCSDIKPQFGLAAIVKETFAYDPFLPAEAPLFEAKKQQILEALRAAGRDLGCKALFHEYGPGSQFQIFEAR